MNIFPQYTVTQRFFIYWSGTTFNIHWNRSIPQNVNILRTVHWFLYDGAAKILLLNLFFFFELGEWETRTTRKRP